MKNIAVYERERDILMNVAASSCNVAWSVYPTSDELDARPITGSHCTGDPTLAELYNVYPSGLNIRKSTTTEDGQPFSTAGLYQAECKSDKTKTGAKLLVVRK